MADINEEFFAMANAEARLDADKLLDKQIERILAWRQAKLDAGETADMRDAIIQAVNEPWTRKRALVVIGYFAALWRLLERDGKL